MSDTPVWPERETYTVEMVSKVCTDCHGSGNQAIEGRYYSCGECRGSGFMFVLKGDAALPEEAPKGPPDPVSPQ